MVRTYLIVATVLFAGACASADDETADVAISEVESAPAVAVSCAPMSAQMEVAGRASPYDSTSFELGGSTAKVCYGRPSSRGRTMLGGTHPYGQLWRTGANEPTTIHLPVAATIAGVAVEPGSYSLYTIPGETEWTIIVNRSISQWGIESAYTADIEAQEVGRGTVAAAQPEAPVETFTIRAEPAAAGTDLILEWENSRVRVPVVPA